ncbi:hypothetical protein Poly30_27930 [Planctomycetes bacterium Poly30]|uniref:Amidohydrolase-related domain-containing protein n=1 Tax=Saltatorellus ferox TaxID=2528018 RepID=A0A518ET67_9BACT|nr:hypothetical protein Poly30_27930 [Planctomycetes bacterium Poly30]
MHVLLLEVIALVGATVHTMEPATAPIEGATVLIEDGVILEVGADVAVPENAEIVDLTGLHLIPGLMDGSVTFDAEHDALYLSAGITLVRDSGSPIGQMLPESTTSMRDRQPGPNLLVASPVFSSGATATREDAFLLDEPQKAAEQIAELVGLLQNASAHVDYFVFERGIQAPQHSVVCGAAGPYGVDVWGPLPERLSLEDARAAGQRSLIGLDSLLKKGQRFETFESDEAFDRWMKGQVGTLKAGDWRVEPFLMGTARILRTAALDEEPEALGALGGLYRTIWRTDIETFGMLRAGDALGPVELSLERQRRFTKALFDAGVQLVPASGAPSGGIAPGAGLVDELEEWSLAGIPAEAILDLAIPKSAQALGVRTQFGQITPGRTASLIACASDPRRSVTALREPEVVVVRGRVLERFHLDEAVDALVKRQTRIEEQRSRPILVEAPPMPDGEVLVQGTADLMAYGSRTAIERYTVVKMADGGMAYGARVLVLPTGKSLARELLLVQIIRDGLVEAFDLTLVELDASGKPVLFENDQPAFAARGRLAEATRKLAISRYRTGIEIDSKAAEEAIAAIDGSTAILGLIGAYHFPVGNSFVAAFDGVAMEPLVDRVRMDVSEEDGRISMNDTRGARVYGFGPGGELRFAARAQAGGRLDLQPGTALGDRAVSELELPEERLFTGDADTWYQTGAAAPKEAGAAKDAEGAGQGTGAAGDGK